MPSSIRLLTIEDINAVVEIAQQSPHNSWTSAVFIDCLKANYTAWVIEHNNSTAAFLIALMVEGECQLMNIGVNVAHQRRGLASELMTHLIQFSRLNQCDHIFLEVRASNQSAIRLYEKHGFKHCSIRRNYYPLPQGREDALIYQLDLLCVD